jgi:hypothetical protein
MAESVIPLTEKKTTGYGAKPTEHVTEIPPDAKPLIAPPPAPKEVQEEEKK